MSQKFKSEVQLEALNNATVDTDKFLVSDSSTVKYRTGAQLLSDLGIAGTYVPYTGATGNVNLGTHTLSSYNLIVNHTSGSGVAASITKGGSGEALTINKTSGSGNAMSVTGGLTSLVDLTLSSIANATIDTDRFIVSDSGTIKYRTGAQVLSDIGGQAALTNPVTGTGTTNYVTKFTGTSTVGNSQLFDNGTNVGIGTTSPSAKLDVNGIIASLGCTIGTNALGTDRMFQISGTSFTSGSTQFGIVNNPTMTTPTNIYGYYGAVTVTSATNSYALYLEATSGTITNKYGIYQSGSGDINYFSGNVGIGTTSPAGQLDVYTNAYKQFHVNYPSIYQTRLNFGTAGYLAYDAGPATLSLFANDIYGSIALGAGGSERMRITDSGNVGIGTSSPSAKLQVQGSVILDAVSGANTTYKYNGTNDWVFGEDSGEIGRNFNLYNYNTASINFSVNRTTGNVGIGTTSPAARLDVSVGQEVNGYSLSGYPFLKYSSGDVLDFGAFGATWTALRFLTNGNERMRITSGGNVGIGTSSPNEALSIAGNIELTNGANRYIRIGSATYYYYNLQSVGDDFQILEAGTTPRLTIKYPNGNVGIGTSSPGFPLEVNGAIVSKGGGFGGADGTFGFGGSQTSITGNAIQAYVAINTGGSGEKMRIDSSGNVGIGTTSPSNKLQISDGTVNMIMNPYSGVGYQGTLGTHDFATITNGLERMRITSAGNVGIGTTSISSAISGSAKVLSIVDNTTTNVASFRAYGGGTLTSIELYGAASAVGLFGSTDTPMIFSTNSTEKMRLTSGGNVGIGTTSVDTKLHVVSTENGNWTTTFANNSSGGHQVYTGYNNGATRYGVYIANGGNDSNSYDLAVGSNKFYVLGSGNVGIGTTSPAYKLEVNGSINVYPNNFFRYDGDTGIIGSATAIVGGSSNQLGIRASNDILFATNGSNERMRVATSGYVGIGTTNPQRKLDVVGSHTTSTFRVYYPDLNVAGQDASVDIWASEPGVSYNGSGIGSNVNRQPYYGRTNPALGQAFLRFINGNMMFHTSTGDAVYAERMRIDSAGNVGIGTSSPNRLLTVAGTTSGLIALNASSYRNTTIGSDSTGNFIVYDDNAGAYRMVINSAGNVGIGTTSPSTKLHLYLADGVNDNTLRIQQGTNAYASGINLVANNDGGAVYNFINSQTNGGTEHWRIGGGATASTMAISTGGTERMRITSGGTVGIGTSTPYSKLDVQDYTSFLSLSSTINSEATTDNQQIGGIDFRKHYSLAIGASIRQLQAGGTSNYSNAHLAFYTNNGSVAFGSVPPERMRITDSGNVGIGTTSPGAKLDVNGDALINNVTIGRGPGNISTNTAIGTGALDSTTTANYNIALGWAANVNNNANGLTAIGVDLNVGPDTGNLGQDCLAIAQFNSNADSAQVPHIYAPKPVAIPTGGATNVITFDFLHYAGAIIEYMIRLDDGGDYAVGTVYTGWKSSGSGNMRDVRQIEWSNMSGFVFSLGGAGQTLVLTNTSGNDAWIRITVRGMMTN
jgi:hypothetical protein